MARNSIFADSPSSFSPISRIETYQVTGGSFTSLEILRGKYRIVREIARSNDIVYEATDVALGRRLAIKELNLTAGLTGSDKLERIERFRREAQTAIKASHPNIVTIFDVGEENGRHFIVMEFLEGQSLRDKLHTVGAFSLREGLEIIYQLLDALAHAHRNGVVHRDIKPDNIHILPGGQVKLTDFGIARQTSDAGLTRAGQVFGTPSYMSPEQIEGKPIDLRSDIFSVGVLLYEMLTGRKPFLGDNVVAITYAIMNAPPAPMQGVPSAVEAAILRAMSKNPLGRFASADEMKAELKRAEMAPAFLPSPSQMGYPNMTGGYQVAGLPQVMPQNAYPQSQSLPPISASGSLPQSPQPWAFNNGNPGIPSGNINPGSGRASGGMTQVSGIPPGGFGAIPGQNAASPPFAVRPPLPAVELSPGMKTFLLSLTIAALIGGGIALGVVAFLRGYDGYKVTASHAQVAALMTEGAKAYNVKDYKTALQKFDAAKHEVKDKAQELEVNQNLANTDIALGNAEMTALNWAKAKAWYDKALEIATGDVADLARLNRAKALEQMGQHSAAVQDRAAVNTDPARPVPASTDSRPLTRDEWQGERLRQARQTLAEAEKLYNQNRVQEARDKWQEVVRVAPGTDESNTALGRLEATKQSYDANNPGGSPDPGNGPGE